MTTKIKLKLSAAEIRSLIMMLGLMDKSGIRQGIQGLASQQLIRKILFRMLPRIENIKKEKNSMALSFPEAWALSWQMDLIQYYVGSYEKNLWMKISMEINKQTI